MKRKGIIYAAIFQACKMKADSYEIKKINSGYEPDVIR